MPNAEESPRWQHEARAAGRDVLGVGPGMVLLGVGFGLLVIDTGLAWWWAPVFSGLIYAGSLEFLLLALVGAGAPLLVIATTTVLVNGRHVFYALSFPLRRVRGRAARSYAVFALIDEAYALIATRPDPMTHARILWTQALLQACWVGGGLVGALAGSGLGLQVPGIDFVFTALFVVLALDATRQRRNPSAAGAALACALLALAVAPEQMLLVAMALFVGVLLAYRRIAPPTTTGPTDA